MVLYGPLSSRMVTYGPVWSGMVPYGSVCPVWPLMVPNGPVWSMPQLKGYKGGLMYVEVKPVLCLRVHLMSS